MKVPIVSLGKLADFDPAPPRKQLLQSNSVVAFMPMASVIAETPVARTDLTRMAEEVLSGYTYFQRGDVLVAKITPCFENCKIAIADIAQEYGFGTTEFHVIRAKTGLLDAKYLTHFLRQPWVIAEGERKMTGSAGQRRVPRYFLEGLEIPVPLIEKQRRIAAILDQAEAMRAKRRQALAKLDTLTQSVFLEMFGDPSKILTAWPQERFAHLLELPLRNGLSPSNIGTIAGQVLTLSAVTGRQFDALCSKSAFFARSAPLDQTVSKRDLLICRGNGNLNLVGKGYFPDRDMADTLFPDTIIAARISPTKVDRLFLEFVWNTSVVRTQIERVARTTNGTLKVNQGMLEELRLPMPPLERQQEFGRKLQSLRLLRGKQAVMSSAMESMHTSLHHRAFRGEL